MSKLKNNNSLLTWDRHWFRMIFQHEWFRSSMNLIKSDWVASAPYFDNSITTSGEWALLRAVLPSEAECLISAWPLSKSSTKLWRQSWVDAWINGVNPFSSSHSTLAPWFSKILKLLVTIYVGFCTQLLWVLSQAEILVFIYLYVVDKFIKIVVIVSGELIMCRDNQNLDSKALRLAWYWSDHSFWQQCAEETICHKGCL